MIGLLQIALMLAKQPHMHTMQDVDAFARKLEHALAMKATAAVVHSMALAVLERRQQLRSAREWNGQVPLGLGCRYQK